jgi:hypothetical protein
LYLIGEQAKHAARHCWCTEKIDTELVRKIVMPEAFKTDNPEKVGDFQRKLEQAVLDFNSTLTAEHCNINGVAENSACRQDYLRKVQCVVSEGKELFGFAQREFAMRIGNSLCNVSMLGSSILASIVGYKIGRFMVPHMVPKIPQVAIIAGAMIATIRFVQLLGKPANYIVLQ